VSDLTIPKKYDAAQAKRLTEAMTALRLSPAHKVLLEVLEDLLEQRKNELVTNTSAIVPTLQGRAQQLNDIIAILQRKP
jgi:hypothetical protein